MYICKLNRVLKSKLKCIQYVGSVICIIIFLRGEYGECNIVNKILFMYLKIILKCVLSCDPKC